MRILLVNQGFYPDVAATAQHAHDLARHLVARGHDVAVIASRSLYGERGASMPRREVIDGIEIHRVGRSFFGKGWLVGRAFDFGLFLAAAIGRSLLLPRPDVSICLTTPPFIALVGVLLKWLKGSRFVYWIMDVYPDVPVECGVMKRDGFWTRLLERLHRVCLSQADRIVVLGRCMEHRIRGKGVPQERLVRIGVWADPEEILPIANGSGELRDRLSLGDCFVVMYAGNFGLAHDVETICRTMLELKDDHRIRFVMAGGGKSKPELERFVHTHGLSDVIMIPHQSRSQLTSLLGAADLHLVTMRPGFAGLIVPSKLFGIMAAARAALFVGPEASEVAQVLAEHDCGWTLPPGDHAALARAIRRLAADRERAVEMGQRARRALERFHSRQHACESWTGMIENVARQDGLHPAPRVTTGAAGAASNGGRSIATVRGDRDDR